MGFDFRISNMDTDGLTQFDANEPAVTYNGIDDEFLVVWEGDGSSLVDGEFEIWGRRIDGATGDLVELEDFLISEMGDPGDPAFDAQSPAVTHNTSPSMTFPR